MSGRRAEAERNDERVLAAAREVFVELGPDAPMSAVAARADVGMGSLYRRYSSKNDLIRELCVAAMRQVIAEAENALREEPDGWSAFGRFMRRCIAGGTGALLPLGGSFVVTDDVLDVSERARDAIQAVLHRAQADGALRTDVTAADVSMLFAQLVRPQVPDGARAGQLRERYVEVILAGLRPSAPALPGPAPDWSEIQKQWEAPPA